MIARLLETEHALVMLLLMYSLLIYSGNKLSRWKTLVILIGILLAVFTPIHEVSLFWPIITGVVVPPLLWQAAVAVAKSGPLRRWSSLAIWVITLILITFSLQLFSALPFSNALLIAMLAVTLLWYFRELEVERSSLSTLGKIALAVLLLEIDIAVISLQNWIGNLLSGTGIGIAVGFIGVYLYRRWIKSSRKSVFFFLWTYVAYLSGLLFQTSPISTTLAAALVVAVYGYSIRLWDQPEDIPLPSNSSFFFILASGVWILLGWQAHILIAPTSLAGIPVALVVITIAILTARKYIPIATEHHWTRLLQKEFSVLLLLLGGVLLWPEQAFLTTISVEIALAAALLLIFFLRQLLEPLFELLGVGLSWPTETLK